MMDVREHQARPPATARPAHRAVEGAAPAGTEASAGLGQAAQRANAGPHAASLAGMRSVLAQRACADCDTVKETLGSAGTVQRAADGGDSARSARALAPRVHVEPSGQALAGTRGGAAVQRVVLFDEDLGTIQSIDVRRPTSGLQSSTRKGTNYHTTAIVAAQHILATNLPGKTYAQALEFIDDRANDIVTMPGFESADGDVQARILGDIDAVHLYTEQAREAGPMNWAAHVENACELYLQALDQLDYTYHEKGSGAVGASGEGTYANILKAYSQGEDVDERKVLESALRLLDLRGYKPGSVKEAAPVVAQYLEKIMSAYPPFATNEYLRTALVTLIAQELGLDSGDLFQAVDSMLYIPY